MYARTTDKALCIKRIKENKKHDLREKYNLQIAAALMMNGKAGEVGRWKAAKQRD